MHPYRTSTFRNPPRPSCALCSDTGIVRVTVVSAPRITPYPEEYYHCSCSAEALRELTAVLEGYKHEEEQLKRHLKSVLAVGFAAAAMAFHFFWMFR